MRTLLPFICAVLLCGCQLIYKLPTRQGNVIEQKQLDQLQTGMSREQVRYLMGTPIAASPFRSDRWDYVGYYRSPRGKIFNRTVTLYFDADSKLTRMEGIKLANADGMTDSPDVENVIREEKKAKLENERSQSEKGGVFAPQPTDPNKTEPDNLPNP